MKLTGNDQELGEILHKKRIINIQKPSEKTVQLICNQMKQIKTALSYHVKPSGLAETLKSKIYFLWEGTDTFLRQKIYKSLRKQLINLTILI